MSSPFPSQVSLAVGGSIGPLAAGISIAAGDLFGGALVGGQTAYVLAPQTAFQASLLTAMYRGVPFGVLDNSGEIGRRGELHEYPGRDIPYAEDLGRRARKIELRAFVIGDDCSSQRDQLIAALEQKGAGLLIHPSAGAMTLQPDPRRPPRYTERWDHGRVVEFELYFVEAGQLLFPQGAADTQAASQTAADNIDVGGGSDLQAGTVSIKSIDLSTVNSAGAALNASSTSGLQAPTTADASSPNVSSAI